MEGDALRRRDESFYMEGTQHEAVLLCDLLHPEGGAEVLATYGGFYAGMPVLTKNVTGRDGILCGGAVGRAIL
ncbi:MAG: beta-galactosidase trimerization domain-containing protein [Roseburia sp.]